MTRQPASALLVGGCVASRGIEWICIHQNIEPAASNTTCRALPFRTTDTLVLVFTTRTVLQIRSPKPPEQPRRWPLRRRKAERFGKTYLFAISTSWLPRWVHFAHLTCTQYRSIDMIVPLLSPDLRQDSRKNMDSLPS